MRLNKYIILFSIFLLLPAAIAFAQQGARDAGNAAVHTPSIAAPDLVAKPSYEATNGGMRFKVWIMSVIKGLKESEIKRLESSWEDGELVKTHHVMIEVFDPMDGSTVSDALVELRAISPSGKELTVELNPMMAQYGGDLNFSEKGEYQLNISVNSHGRSILTPFVYSVN